MKRQGGRKVNGLQLVRNLLRKMIEDEVMMDLVPVRGRPGRPAFQDQAIWSIITSKHAKMPSLQKFIVCYIHTYIKRYL